MFRLPIGSIILRSILGESVQRFEENENSAQLKSPTDVKMIDINVSEIRTRNYKRLHQNGKRTQLVKWMDECETPSECKYKVLFPNSSTVSESSLMGGLVTTHLDILKGEYSQVNIVKVRNQVVNQQQGESRLRAENEVRNKWSNTEVYNCSKGKDTNWCGPPPTQPTQAEENIINYMRDTASFCGVPGGRQLSLFSQKSNGTADYVFIRQLNVMERELVKTNLQSQLLERSDCTSRRMIT
ncbi:unnamed protein product [Mytilus coruscus]|uniref:Uncharacterized protein n=1 Tax=Mytilus coruscus TaxID=42192 RepID=A0A6J8B2H7_MYTCO|nr:unnamed protein product [Mytilus coruscus]